MGRAALVLFDAPLVVRAMRRNIACAIVKANCDGIVCPPCFGYGQIGRMRSCRCTILTLLAVLTASSGGVAGPPQPDAVESEALFASPTRLDRIGRVVAPVTINGRGPYRLVVDTGASHSTFSPQLAASLGLSPSHESSLRLNGVTGVAEVPTVKVERLQAGDVLFENARVPVVWSSIMSNADGILGLASLREERLLVDFRRDQIAITRSRKPLDARGYLTVPARRVAGGLLMVETTIGGIRTRAVIDTGAERTLGNMRLRDALRSRHRGLASRWADTDVYGATDEVSQGQSAIAPPIKFGTVTINGTEVTYGDFHIFKLWKLDKYPAALIGMDVLGTVGAMVIDFRNSEIHFDLRPSSSAAATTARSD